MSPIHCNVLYLSTKIIPIWVHPSTSGEILQLYENCPQMIWPTFLFKASFFSPRKSSKAISCTWLFQHMWYANFYHNSSKFTSELVKLLFSRSKINKYYVWSIIIEKHTRCLRKIDTQHDLIQKESLYIRQLCKSCYG